MGNEYDDDAANYYQSDESADSDAMSAWISDENQYADNIKAALDGGEKDVNNPYFTIELIFLMLCGVGIVVMFIYVQKHEWLETLRVLNEQRVNKRKYGFNRINVVFDTEDTDSDYLDYDNIEKHKMDNNVSLSGDEDLGSNNESPINDSE